MGAGVRQDTETGRETAAALLAGECGPIGGRLVRSGPDAWTAFDEAVRHLAQLSPGGARGNPLELRLCHPDGRVREAALAAWRNPPPQLVLIRCADWVPQVRERARRVLGRLVAKDPAGWLTLLTPLVLRLGRREHGAWALEQLEAALSGRYSLLAAWWRPGRPSTTWSLNSLTAVQREAVLDRLCLRADPPTRRFATRLTVAAGEMGVRELALRAAREPDPATARLWTDAALRVMAADGPDDTAVDALLTGHLPMVRASGVTALHGAGRADEAARYLTDRSGLVRACARRLVPQGGGDPRALCHRLVEDPARVTPYAVTGFAECAHREDAPLLRALLDHPAGAVRAAAVAGLRLLDSSDTDLLRPLLDDPSPGVAREASLSLRPSAERLPADWLAARTAPGWPTHTRRAAYRLLHARGGVYGLRAAVELLEDEDPHLRRIAAQHLQSMYSPSRPPALPLRDPEVGALLDRCTGLFSDWVLAWMRSQLGLPSRGSTTNG
ncbi:hypothetical protein OTB20_02495 [Streptomyces sp. H27-H1]|uniref:HEAT repeat domain-containing protein n=1 Tax=Streptomyces sp. H27-H1 TaxID=2996461 RepID=UPI00226DAB5B|nr:HEAT repeat domain-containing protein [Streptomyces sp. H27-H1]MCY0925090.1 hypothetical protein [Streptomyces sp. H27-H1]